MIFEKHVKNIAHVKRHKERCLPHKNATSHLSRPVEKTAFAANVNTSSPVQKVVAGANGCPHQSSLERTSAPRHPKINENLSLRVWEKGCSARACGQRQLEVGRDQSMVCQIPLPDHVKGDKLPIWEAASGS